MKEQACRFGDGGGLVGIVTQATADKRSPELPAVILLSAGMVHRVGPHRLYVEVARSLAALGFPVLRFDLAGVGDSELPEGKALLEDRTISVVQQAMNFLAANEGAKKFVLMGLCSGATDSHRVAVADARVQGIVALDGYAYRTLRYYWQRLLVHYGRRMLVPAKWKRLAELLGSWLRDRMTSASNATGGPAGETRDALQDPNARVFPPKAAVRRELERLILCGVNMLYIYSGGVPDLYNYKAQFRQMFRPLALRDRVQVEYFSKANHTYTLIEDRGRLVAVISDWMRTHYLPAR